MAKKSPKSLPSFEQSLQRLEEIVRQTDAPMTELESMIALVEEGTKLIRHCRSILRQAELRIEVLENPEDEDQNDQSISSSESSQSDGTAPFSLS